MESEGYGETIRISEQLRVGEYKIVEWYQTSLDDTPGPQAKLYCEPKPMGIILSAPS